MSQNTKETMRSDANTSTKRSRWKFFSGDRSKTDITEPEVKPTGNVPPSTDSTYGSSGPNSAQPSENECSTHSSATLPPPPENLRVASISPPLGAQSSFLSPQNALTKHHDTHHSNPDVTMTSPSIRKETRQDPSTGNTVTIVTTTTTTTTTTTVTGPNGTTVIEEPRAELGDGRRTPDPSLRSEAVNAAINGQGDGGLYDSYGDEDTRPVSDQWKPITPGRRPIPQRDANSSVTDLNRVSALEDHSQPAPMQSATKQSVSMQPAPMQSATKQSVSMQPAPMQSATMQSATMQSVPMQPAPLKPAAMHQSTAPPILPPRHTTRKPVQRPIVPTPGGDTANGENALDSPGGSSRNFSYPTQKLSQTNLNWANTPQALRPGSQVSMESPSTLANLKMAAAGLHGAGEALRGTLNQTADRRFRADKASEAKLAKHQEAIDRGRFEIENRKFAPYNAAAGPQQGSFPQRPQHQPQQPQQPQHLPHPQHPQHPQHPGNPQSWSTPQPDGQPTHVELARRRFSGSYNVRPLSPKEEPAPQPKSGIGKWLHKAKSHPSDKDKETGLRKQDQPSPAPVNNGKLKRRSKQQLAAVVE